MTEDQLLAHARRCYSLAEVCLDPVVSKKLHALGNDYWAYSQRNAERPADETPELLPPRQRPDHGGTPR